MKRHSVVAVAALICALSLAGQRPPCGSGSGQRQIWPDDDPPPLFKGAKKDTDCAKLPPVAKIQPVPAAIPDLGLGYAILVQDDASGGMVPADPGGLFKDGNCIQFEFLPNRSGYLYVIEQGSSKRWKPLMPLAGDDNRVESQVPITLPPDRNQCLPLEPPSGTERVFVMLSRNPQDTDLLNLDKAVQLVNGATGVPGSAGPCLADCVQLALDSTISKLSATRDIGARVPVRHNDSQGPTHFIYLVNDHKSDRIIAEIDVKH